jgi:hypothetical protein
MFLAIRLYAKFVRTNGNQQNQSERMFGRLHLSGLIFS